MKNVERVQSLTDHFGATSFKISYYFRKVVTDLLIDFPYPSRSVTYRHNVLLHQFDVIKKFLHEGSTAIERFTAELDDVRGLLDDGLRLLIKIATSI